MREAVLPFLGYLLLQLFAAVVGLNIIREKKSITYLVCDEDDESLMDYFAITHKAV